MGTTRHQTGQIQTQTLPYCIHAVFSISSRSPANRQVEQQIQNHSDTTELHCANQPCNALLGRIDTSTHEGYKLHKPSLSLSVNASAKHNWYSSSKWLSLHILTAVESQGVRKFTIPAATISQFGKEQTKQIKLWIFTPDLLVSTSAIETNEPVRVAKILWQEETRPEGEAEAPSEKLSRQALSEGELSLREDEVQSLVQLLRASAAWLPYGARKFGDWDVGLLERFTKSDLKVAETVGS